MGRLSQIYGTAFVSGASAGLGRAFAQMLLGEGVRVWGSSRDPKRLGGLPGAGADSLVPVALDLADREGAVRAYRGASAAAGGFDLFINNAGFGVFGEFAGVEAGVWGAQLDAMLGTVLSLSHEAFRSMVARDRGCIVHVSSLAAEFPIPFMSGYNVAKAGMSALSESLMYESRGSAVKVIDFRPGDYRTNFNRAMQNNMSSDLTRRAWAAQERGLAASPVPELAALDLRRALLAERSAVVRSGSFFQARLAPALARLLPRSWVRAVSARYFGL